MAIKIEKIDCDIVQIITKKGGNLNNIVFLKKPFSWNVLLTEQINKKLKIKRDLVELDKYNLHLIELLDQNPEIFLI